MQNIVSIILVLITSTFAFSQNKKQYQYRNDIPTKNGIQHYIDLNKDKVETDIENFINDTIFSYNIIVENLSENQNYDSLEAGRFYPDNEIVITNELKFFDYELSFVPGWKQKRFDNNTKFVKGVLIHEFMHLYIFQFINDCFENNIPVNSEFIYFNMFPASKFNSSEFIEEGICEYVVMKLKEGIFSDYKLECLSPHNETAAKNFTRIQNTYDIKYQYSRKYVQKIFENNSFKNALQIILTCKPPSFEELLCPDKYYYRLVQHARESGFYDFKILVKNSIE